MALTHQDALRNTLCATTTAAVDAGSANAAGRVVFFDEDDNQCAVIGLSNPAFQSPLAGIAMANPTIDDNSPVVGKTLKRYEVQNRDMVWVYRDSVGPGLSLGDVGQPIPAATPLRLLNFFYRAPF